MEVDYLIVGQGLAGSILLDKLMEKGVSVVIVDKHREITSSKVAAGIMNPVTGRRFAKTWMAETIFPYAIEYYLKKEKQLNNQYYFPLPIQRLFGSIEDQNAWMGRSAEEEIKPFIIDAEMSSVEGVKDDFGHAMIGGGGYLDTHLYLDNFRANYKKYIIDDQLDYDKLVVQNSHIQWKNISAKRIIFCEGFRTVKNPYFSWLPFTLAKGEVFDIEVPGLPQDRIYNKGGFVMPRKNGTFKMGATYRWNEMTETPTQRSREELIEKGNKILTAPYSILNQKASIRPTVKDRRPFLGQHPNQENFYVFNGFGSKGVTLIPYFAEHFVSHLEEGNLLLDEVNISRYYDLYPNT